jgi:hypothetical protein
MCLYTVRIYVQNSSLLIAIMTTPVSANAIAVPGKRPCCECRVRSPSRPTSSDCMCYNSTTSGKFHWTCEEPRPGGRAVICSHWAFAVYSSSITLRSVRGYHRLHRHHQLSRTRTRTTSTSHLNESTTPHQSTNQHSR